MDLLKKFYQEEEGMGTVEIVMIIGALLCIALLFKNTLIDFVKDLMKNVFKTEGADNSGKTDSAYGST